MLQRDWLSPKELEVGLVGVVKGELEMWILIERGRKRTSIDLGLELGLFVREWVLVVLVVVDRRG